MNKKGFTLIELLVVIAIIGILSGIVLTSLGSARNKAKAASVQSSLSSMRAEAELAVTSGGKYPASLCNNGNPGGPLNTLVSAVTTNGGKDLTCTRSGSSGDIDDWAVSATLPDSTTFCVSSAGVAKASSTAAANGVCS